MTTQFVIAIQSPDASGTRPYFYCRIHPIINSPTPYFHSNPSKILVLPGTSLDFSNLRKSMLRYKVINKKNEWTYGNGHLVIFADFLKDEHLISESLWYIYSLEERAKRHHGYIHLIVNPEGIMNLNQEWKSAHPQYAMQTKSNKNCRTAFYGGNKEIYRWLCTKNSLEIIGSNVFAISNTQFIRRDKSNIIHNKGKGKVTIDWQLIINPPSVAFIPDQSELSGLSHYLSKTIGLSVTRVTDVLIIKSKSISAPKVTINLDHK